MSAPLLSPPRPFVLVDDGDIGNSDVKYCHIVCAHSAPQAYCKFVPTGGHTCPDDLSCGCVVCLDCELVDLDGADCGQRVKCR